MKKYFTLFATIYLIHVFPSLMAQETHIDSTLVFLNKSKISSGILLQNKMDSVLNLFELNGNNTNPQSYDQWRDLNFFISRGNLTGVLIPDFNKLRKISDSIKFNYYLQQQSVIPLFIQNYKVDIIKEHAVDSGLLLFENGKYYDNSSSSQSPYEERHIIFCGFFQQFSPENTVSFLLTPETFITNVEGELLSVEINADDSMGYRQMVMNQPLSIIYTTEGLKNIVIKVITTGGTYTTGFQLKTGIQCSIGGDVPDEAPWSYLDNLTNMHWDISTVYNGETVAGNAYLKYSPGLPTVLDKPFIFVEGIDFNTSGINSSLQNGDLGYCGIFFGGNNMEEPEDDNYFFLEKYPNLIAQLQAEGYDMILLDFYDGADYVEKNSMLLVRLIQLVNQSKYGDEPIIVSGASMGGQISRYALAYMEKNNMPHCARMYISMDSPHKGSNIVPGLQNMMKFLAEEAMPTFSSSAQEQLHKTLERPAGQELLNYSVVSGAAALKNAYYTSLNTLGYPQAVRRVGIANGTRNGAGLPFSDSDLLFEFIWSPNFCLNSKAVDLKIRATPGPSASSEIFYGKAPRSEASIETCFATLIFCALCFQDAMYFATNSVSMSSNTSVDRAPGGKRRTLGDTEKKFIEAVESNPMVDFLTNPTIEAYQKDHSFIPTISALDINTNDLFLNLDNNIDFNNPSPNMTPFNAIWAPLDNNEQHSEATDDNIAFVMSEVIESEFAAKSPLTSSSPNSGVYNVGEKCNYIKSINIHDGGKLYFNADLPMGYWTTIQKPDAGSTLNVETCFCDNPNTFVEIGDNGQMILGEASPNNKAIVKFKSGSTLRIETGGKLIINDNSQLLIESGANLIIEEGAQIELNGTNAVLELQGTTEIGDNAIFTFTGAGFIRYNVPSQSTPGIIAGTNSQIYLSGQVLGSGDYQKVLEIKGSTLWPEDDLKLFRIEKGGIDFLNVNSSNYPCLNLGCPYQLFRCNFTGDGNLTVWGTANSLISTCTFDNVSIQGNLYDYQNILKIRGTTIKNITNNGLTTVGQGVELYNVTFENCGVGWDAESLLKPSIVAESNFNNNTTGICIDKSGKLSSLLVKNSTITNNIDGIYSEGFLTLGLKCGNINNNDFGVTIKYGGALSMSSYDKTGGVDLSNNYESPYSGLNISLDKARNLNIDQGFNKFYTVPGAQQLEAGAMLISGTIYKNTCYEDQLIPIWASNNKWYSSPTNYSLPDESKYSLFTFNYDCPNSYFGYSIEGINNEIPPMPSCRTIPNNIPANSDFPNPLKICPSCTTINTTDFQNVAYNVAIESTIALMDLEDSTENDIPIIDKFSQILLTPLDSTNKNMLWLADLAFSKMDIALANAFKTGLITEADNVSSLHPSVQKVIDVYNHYTSTEKTNNFMDQFYLKFSKAQVYVLAGRREIALSILDSIKITNCYIGQDELKLLKRTRELINAEQLIVTGVVSRDKFDSLYTPYIPPIRRATQINSTASVSSSAQLGQSISIGTNSVIQQNVILGDSVSVGNNVTIKQNTVIGDGTIIGNGTTIEKDVIIGENSVIGENVKLKKECKIGDYDTIANNAELEEKTKIGSYAIVGQNSKMKKESLVAEGSMLGENNSFDKNAKIGSNVIIGNNADIKKEVNIGDGSIIGNNVKINQNAKIGSNTIINDNLTLGSNSKLCDDLSINTNINNNGQIGTCVTPSSPATALQVQYNCDFAIARAKNIGYFFNGFKAVNVDTSNHIFYSNSKIRFVSKLLSTTFHWDFGDCSTSTEETPVHEYAKPGIYVITLTINNFCNSVQYIGSITIAPDEINPSFNIITSANCISDNLIKLGKNNFIADLTSAACYTNTQQCKSYALLDSSLLRVKFNWDFGTIRQPLEEIFTIKQLANNSDSILKCYINQAGEYPIKLEATLQGKSFKTNTWVDTKIVNIFYDTINYKNISTDFGYDSITCYTDSVKFINKTTGGMKPLFYKWNFGDGTSSTTESPVKIYNSPGTYNVTLISQDMTGCADTIIKQVVLSECPTISGILYENIACDGIPVTGDTLQLTFNSIVVDSISYAITHEDGSFRFDANELATLDTTLLYSIETKSGIAIENSESKIINEWIESSPVALQLSKVGYQWKQSYTSNIDTLQSTGQAVDLNGNVYVLGNIYRSDLFEWKYLLIKYSPAGEQLWAVTDTTASGYYYAKALATDEQFNVYITGYGYFNEQNYILTQKYDSSGILIWSDANQVLAVSDQIFIAAGNEGDCYVSFNPNGEDGYSDSYLIKYNNSGDIEWTQATQPEIFLEQTAGMVKSGNNICIGINSFTETNRQLIKLYNASGSLDWERDYHFGTNDKLINITADKEGNIYCLGEYTDSLLSEHIIAYKLDRKGVIRGDFDILNEMLNNPVFIRTDSAGNVYISCVFSIQLYSTNINIIKLNPDLSYAWEQTITTGVGGNAVLTDMDCDNSGNIYIADNITRFFHQLVFRTSEVYKIDQSGSTEWHYNNGSSISDVAVSPNDNVYIAGSDIIDRYVFPGYLTYRSDINTEKLIQCPGSAGNLKIQNLQTQVAVITIGENYVRIIPNPNDGNMQVVYKIAENETGVLEIYDLLGKKILQKELVGGYNLIAISESTLNRGIYYYRAILNGKQIASDKIVVIK